MPPFNPDAPGQVTSLNRTFNGSHETIDIDGTIRLTVPAFPNITVNLLSNNTEWIGGFTQNPGNHLTVAGVGLFDNLGTSRVAGTATIGVNVGGPGTFNDTGKLEFMHTVDPQQTVTVGDRGVLQIDSPANYHAMTKVGCGEIILEGLKATSYSLKGDLLNIFNGKSIVDTMNLSVQSVGGSAPVAFGVSRVGGSVVIHADGSSYRDGGALLAHHA
jgi:hypothetical protein